MNWAAFPYFRVACAFSAGIFFFEYLHIDTCVGYICILILMIWYLIGFTTSFFSVHKSMVSGIQLLLFTFFLGGIHIGLVKHHLFKNANLVPLKHEVLMYGTMKERLKSNGGTKITYDIDWYKDSHQKIIKIKLSTIAMFALDDTSAQSYKPGTPILIQAKLDTIAKNTNPESFDYSYYLLTKNILRQLYVKKGKHCKDTLETGSILYSNTNSARNHVSTVLQKYIQDGKSLGIAEAILIGQKLLLTEDIYKSYTNTGAIHVLSVSGLHVAIFISLFIWLFSMYHNQNIYWKFSKVFILMLIVWFYVFLTGMSPSVVRAGTMVSFYIIGKNLFKGTNSFNLLSIAAIIMLIYNPYYLFQVSFQFSFISLLSILYFQPKISNWFTPANKYQKFFWDLINVSIAAQILIFPFTVLYFHQFPVYFAISGIVAVPLVTFIIYVGTFMAVLEPFWPTANAYISNILNGLLELLNYCILEISQWPHSTISNIWLSNISFVLIIFVILMIIFWVETVNNRFLFVALIIFSLVGVNLCWENYTSNNTSNVICYDTKGGTITDIISNRSRLSIYTGVMPEKSITFATNNSRMKDKVSDDSYVLPDKRIHNSYLCKLGDKVIYINNPIENPSFIKNIKVDILVVTKNKYNSPELLFNKFQPDIIVLERNLPPWVTDRWLAISDKYQCEIHNIKTKGAFVYTLNN